MSQDKTVGLAISGKHYETLRAHLFPGDGKEAVAFAVCGRARRPECEMLLVRDVIAVPYASCHRSEHRITWPGTVLDPILTRAMAEGLGLVKIHSHPNGYPWFSDTDDQADADLFPSVFGWLGNNGPMASAIMLPDGTLVGRSVTENGISDPLARIRVAGSEFKFWPDVTGIDVPAHDKRTAQAFGEGTYARLRGLKVGVVGCSGTGSVVIEQLARNSIGTLVLVDCDHIESKNLNRILNSTAVDAATALDKPSVQARAIKAMEMGTKITMHPYALSDRRALDDLSTCDVVFGCMDSIDGRHILNKLSTAYLIPYIDVGVRLDADRNGGIDGIWLAVHTLQPGGSSLKSRRVYDQADLEAAFLQRNSVEYERLKKHGYVKNVDVDRPAVISVNMQAASIAVNEFLARIHGFRFQPCGAFAVRKVALHDEDNNLVMGDGDVCLEFARGVGRGDQSPFLGMPALGE